MSDLSGPESLFSQPPVPPEWEELGLLAEYPYVNPRSALGYLAIDLAARRHTTGARLAGMAALLEIGDELFAEASAASYEAEDDLNLFAFMVKSMKTYIWEFEEDGVVLEKGDEGVYEALADKVRLEAEIYTHEMLAPRSSEDSQRLVLLADTLREALISDFGQHFKKPQAA